MKIKEEKAINDGFVEWHGTLPPMPEPLAALARPILNQYLNQMCDLMDKYATLRCECKRFADYVLNLTQNHDATAIQFEDEYLRMAGNMLYEAFACIPKFDPEEIIKELKK